MKKAFVFTCAVILASCSSNTSKNDSVKTEQDSTTTVEANITSPYGINYSSKFVMDNPKNAENLLTIWKDWDNGNLSAHKDLFADSVEMHFSDGTSMHTSRDSALASAQSARSAMATAVSSVDAIIAVKSTDKNENWALIWGKEVDTDKKGIVDSFYLQETWRFNKDGKADLFFQYRQAAAKK
jgi:hypothetical protein